MDRHPYRAVWETRDLAAWADALAPEVVLRSPITSAPITGRDAAIELFEVLLDALVDFDITDELADTGARAFFWRANTGDGRAIEGADLVRQRDDGLITEITVLLRPLRAIAAFSAAVGPQLASRRGRAQGAAVRIMGAPLRVLLTVPDVIAGRVVARR